MKEMSSIEKILNDFIKSLPRFIEGKKDFYKQVTVYYGEITPPIMELWCNIASKHGIPFVEFGDIRDYHNDMYLAWSTRRGFIYVTADYSKVPSGLTWGIFEIDDDICEDGE